MLLVRKALEETFGQCGSSAELSNKTHCFWPGFCCQVSSLESQLY